jgi:hypothetical protein
MSALPPKADIPGGDQHVCFVPIADMALLHSVTNRRSSTRHKRQNVGFGSPLLSTTAIVCVVCSTRPIAQGHRKPGSKSRTRKHLRLRERLTERSNKVSPSFSYRRGPNKRRTTDKDRRASRRRGPLVPLVVCERLWQARADCKIDWARKMKPRRSRLLYTVQ